MNEMTGIDRDREEWMQYGYGHLWAVAGKMIGRGAGDADPSPFKEFIHPLNARLPIAFSGPEVVLFGVRCRRFLGCSSLFQLRWPSVRPTGLRWR